MPTFAGVAFRRVFAVLLLAASSSLAATVSRAGDEAALRPDADDGDSLKAPSPSLLQAHAPAERLRRSRLVGGVELGPPLVVGADLEVPRVQYSPSPFGVCGDKKVGTASVKTKGRQCTRLGGFATSLSANLSSLEAGGFNFTDLAEDEEVICHLDWCDGGLFGIFPRHNCQDPISLVQLQMTRGDCNAHGFSFLHVAAGPDSEVGNCEVEFCYDLGGFTARPLESCNQEFVLEHTKMEDCRLLGGPVDLSATSSGWMDDCRLDLCQSLIQVDLEIITRDAEGADTTSGAEVYLWHEGKEELHDLTDTARRNDTVRKRWLLTSWPNKLAVRSKGYDDWGISEARIRVLGQPVRLLVDRPTKGLNNNVPSEDTRYWIGLQSIAPYMQELEIPDVNRYWRCLGNDLACNPSQEHLGIDDNGQEATIVKFAGTHPECQSLCEENQDCHGVDFERHHHRCTLWLQPIGRGDPEGGHRCYIYWRDSKLINWRFDHKSSWRMLHIEGHKCLDTAPDMDIVFGHMCTSSLSQLWVVDQGRLVVRSGLWTPENTVKAKPERCLVRKNATSLELVLEPCKLSKGFSDITNVSSSEMNRRSPADGPHGGWTMDRAGLVRLEDGEGLGGAKEACMYLDVVGYEWLVSLKECDPEDVGQRFMWTDQQDTIHDVDL